VAQVALLGDVRSRALLGTLLRAIWDGLRSAVILLPIDPPTALGAMGALARVALLFGPLATVAWRMPRRRLFWLPTVVTAGIVVLGVSVPAVTSALMWAILAGAAAVGWLAAARRSFRIAVLLPWAVAVEPVVGHNGWGGLWSPARLAVRCAENDGVRPTDLTPDVTGTGYYAVTPVSPERLLLTGTDRSFWVRRTNGRATLGDAVPTHANFWQGCVRDGSVWVTSEWVGICELPIPTGDRPPAPSTCHRARGPADLGSEIDYVDPICPSDRPTVYASQLVRGGYLELDPATEKTSWHAVIPGLNLQMTARSDGLIVAITTGRLVVFDPGGDRVLEEHAAGVIAMGLAVCKVDHSAAITDFTGRVRIFERAGDGRYRFRAGALLPAPRRVAFSPDCAHLVVTSGDDRRAFLLRPSDLAVLRTYQLGPGLRDVTFADDRTIAAVDACTVSFIDVPPA
jgi:hypothetical protein